MATPAAETVPPPAVSKKMMINNVNKNVLMAVKSKMREDPMLGKSAPLTIVGVFDPTTGVVSSPNLPGELKAGPVPGLAAAAAATTTMEQQQQSGDGDNNNIPSILSFCPIAVAGCYSLIFMMLAAELDFQFRKYETKTTADMDMSRFFNPTQLESAAAVPWEKVHLEIMVDGPQTLEELQALSIKAHQLCPSTELLEKAMRMSPPNVVVVNNNNNNNSSSEDAQPVESPKTLNGFNLETYRALAANQTSTNVRQESLGVWFCGQEEDDDDDDDKKSSSQQQQQQLLSSKYPGAFMTMKATIGGPWQDDDDEKKRLLPKEEEDAVIAVGQEPPLGSGQYANPVQVCLFGFVAFYLQTMALNLALRGYPVKDLKGTLDLKMNKRKVMGIDLDANVFDASNFTFTVTVELCCCGDGGDSGGTTTIISDAIMAEVVEETALKCPSLAAMTNAIQLDFNISKV